ncbi:hypothetical protein [uncultured Pontibacter sp.]|uniref:hypothetical protein n=1 Tax=uncultured Pontibacter sp. TaxID=453356 RepID=UPI00261A9BDC|nr:hypothetical protein [uncultured Pontibacter sp.]
MRKTLKRIALFVVLAPFALLILGAIAYFAFALYAVGGESAVHQQYLKQNMQEISLSAEDDFKIFDEHFHQNKVYFLGEVHGYAMPQELDFKLLQHLNKKAGLTHYLAEVDYSQAYFLNKYLQTGNEKLLSYVFDTWVKYNAQWGNKEFYDKLKKIYALNKTLPATRQIQIVGVDKIQDMQVTQRHLKELLATYSSGSDNTLDTLQLLVNNDTVKAETLRTYLVSHQPQIKTVAGALPLAEQQALKHVLQNVQYVQSSTNRDSVMYLNLNKLSEVHGWQNDQFYGMWGYTHAMQNQVGGGRTPFAALLQHEMNTFKGKVVSLNIMSLDSENMMPTIVMPEAMRDGKAYVTTSWVNSDGPMVFIDGIKDLKALTKKNSVSIFKVDGRNSPYRTSSRLALTKVLLPGQNIQVQDDKPTIIKACQYVVLIRNSKAATPIKNTI